MYKGKIFYLSFSSEVENQDEWTKAFREGGYIRTTSGITPAHVVVFVGEKIGKEDWELARSFKKLIYNLTGLEVKEGMDMLEILLDNTDWEQA